MCVGLFFIVVSIVVYTSLLGSLLALSLLFSLSFLFGGLSEIVFSIVNRHQMDNWGWSLAFGILTFLVGTSLMMQPDLSLRVLTLYIGFIILFRSIASISMALDLKRYGNKNWGALLVLGILGAIFSFILIWNPLFAGLSMVMWISISFFFAGLFSIFFSLQLRKLHKSSKKISADLSARYEALMEDINKEWEN